VMVRVLLVPVVVMAPNGNMRARQDRRHVRAR
jgi:hypothetical protein